ncbi:MAG: HPF/RaiA family ribosome-associated protein [Candidatus Rokuibacteriota bacterium]
MAMTFTFEGLNHDPALRELILRKLEGLAERLRPAPVSARIAFTDENGPKGGVDTRCTLTIEVPRRPALHVEQIAANHRLAFDGAFAGLEQLVLRERETTRTQRRRPKKYYVAKRLLEGDARSGGEP